MVSKPKPPETIGAVRMGWITLLSAFGKIIASSIARMATPKLRKPILDVFRSGFRSGAVIPGFVSGEV